MIHLSPRSHAPRGNAHPAAPRRVLRRVLLLGLVFVASTGCHKAAPNKEPIEVKPPVHLVKPEKRTLKHQVGQPGYVFAYEQTSMYPKVSGYIEQWLVDRGDLLKQGQLMTRIYVPELHASYEEKQALVKLGEVRVRLAEESVNVAKELLHVATADVSKAQADIKKYEADVARWQSEVKRESNVKVEGRSVINTQIIEESKRQLQLAKAARLAAEAALVSSQATEAARKVQVKKAGVDVEAAHAQVKVDEKVAEHYKALVDYTHMTAPYDGIVTVRNANKGDYVERRYGDESAPIPGNASEAPMRGTPVYIVARTDVMRVYVDVPEMQASFVHRGSKARIRIPAIEDAEFDSTVTRTSGALNERTRTLRTEIDLTNKDGKIRPGMYTYGEIEIERRDVLTVPMAAVIEIGNQNVVYLHEDGKAVRTAVQTGLDDEKYVEVIHKKVKDKWEPFKGDEEVILGDLAELRDGEEVKVSREKGSEKKADKSKPEDKEKK
jgi:HlyD family secretion protein